MVTAKESYQQFTAWNLTSLDRMALLQLRQNYSLPCHPQSSTFAANVGFAGRSITNLPGSRTGLPTRVDGFYHQLPPRWESSSTIIDPFLRDSQCAPSHGRGISANPADAFFSYQKKFLIFDQSGNHTRLFFSSSFTSSPNGNIRSDIAAGGLGLSDKEAAVQKEKQSLLKPIAQEKCTEGRVTGGSEVHEDTEEINALLYSDSNYEYHDDGENDEVTSTGHTPFAIEEGYDKDIQNGELSEEVASTNGSTKRQKLLDGGYKKSFFVDTRGLVKMDSPQNAENSAESSCADERSYADVNSLQRVKKIKIRESLKILESIIPGLESEDPLLVIDKAIIYLKSLKVEAETLGISCL